MSPRAVVAIVIVAGSVLRLGAAAVLGLGVDECYTVANGRSFQLSYFDHAPMSFWLARGALEIFGTDSGAAVRLPFIALGAVTTWLIFRLGSVLFAPWAGAWAAVLLNVTPFFSVVSGSWVLPDGPMLCAALGSALCLAPVLVAEPGAVPRAAAWRAWLSGGLLGGLALLSKYLAGLYALGLVLYLLTLPGRRRWLLNPAPWAGAVLAAAVFSPVLLWNARHDWVSFAFQGGRAEAAGGIHPGNVLGSIGGQALYLLPWIWFPLLSEGVTAVRAGRARASTWLCACLGLPPVVIMSLIPLWGSPGLPHWTAIGYLFLFPLLGHAVAAQLGGPKGRLLRRWLAFSITVFPLLVVVLVGHAATGLGSVLLPASSAARDPTLDTVSWRPVEQLLTDHRLNPDRTVVATLWWIDGAKAGAALGARWPVTVFSDNPHNFQFLHDPASFAGRDVVFVGRPQQLADLETTFAGRIHSFERLGRVELSRRFGPSIELEAVLGRSFKSNSPAAAPRPPRPPPRRR